MKRLIASLFFVILYTGIFAQHAGRSGGGLFYGLAGAVASALVFLLFLGLVASVKYFWEIITRKNSEPKDSTIINEDVAKGHEDIPEVQTREEDNIPDENKSEIIMGHDERIENIEIKNKDFSAQDNIVNNTESSSIPKSFISHDSTTIICPSCGNENSIDFLYCVRCGNKINKKCKRCGNVTLADNAFCPKCGYDLSKENVVIDKLKKAAKSTMHFMHKLWEDFLTFNRKNIIVPIGILIVIGLVIFTIDQFPKFEDANNAITSNESTIDYYNSQKKYSEFYVSLNKKIRNEILNNSEYRWDFKYYSAIEWFGDSALWEQEYKRSDEKLGIYIFCTKDVNTIKKRMAPNLVEYTLFTADGEIAFIPLDTEPNFSDYRNYRLYFTKGETGFFVSYCVSKNLNIGNYVEFGSYIYKNLEFVPYFDLIQTRLSEIDIEKEKISCINRNILISIICILFILTICIILIIRFHKKQRHKKYR